MSECELSRCSSAFGRGHRDHVLVGEVQELLILSGDAVQCSGVVIDMTVVAVVAGCAAEELHVSGDDAHRLGGATVFGSHLRQSRCPSTATGPPLCMCLATFSPEAPYTTTSKKLGFSTHSPAASRRLVLTASRSSQTLLPDGRGCRRGSLVSRPVRTTWLMVNMACSVFVRGWLEVEVRAAQEGLLA
jgi:hypothetical protein